MGGNKGGKDMRWLMEMVEGFVLGKWDEEVEELLGELIIIWIREVM